jgi:hypothetical protein
MIGLLLAYQFYPPTKEWLDRLALLKADWGYAYSALNAILAGACIPELLRILVFQKARFRRENRSNLIFHIPFWCGMGMMVDFFYRCQEGWFGSEVTLVVVVKKVLVDQFLYTPLFAAPVTAWLYHWKNLGYPLCRPREAFTLAYYRDRVVPTVVAIWGVWIPIVTVLYSLPSLLQIPLFGLALSLWVMLYTWMSEHWASSSTDVTAHSPRI